MNAAAESQISVGMIDGIKRIKLTSAGVIRHDELDYSVDTTANWGFIVTLNHAHTIFDVNPVADQSLTVIGLK